MFSPHQVNHGGVQKVPAQVSLYTSHTTEEPLKRCRCGRYSQVLSSHSGQVGKLLTLADPVSTTSEGLCRLAPVGLECTLEAGLPLRQRTRRNPWIRERMSYTHVSDGVLSLLPPCPTLW